MKILLVTIWFFFVCSFGFAQTSNVISSGTIEYEKTSNTYAIINKSVQQDNALDRQFFETYKSNHPQFIKSISRLTFNERISLFQPIDSASQADAVLNSYPGTKQLNIVFTNFSPYRRVSRKKIFESAFLITDTTRDIKWKITNETRVINGYVCRRANGLLLDSIYVVAFYTNAIPVDGGPESFSGLPGMILGVALPHENVTWFATKIQAKEIDEKSLLQPSNGNVLTKEQLLQQLKELQNQHTIRVLTGLLW